MFIYFLSSGIIIFLYFSVFSRVHVNSFYKWGGKTYLKKQQQNNSSKNLLLVAWVSIYLLMNLFSFYLSSYVFPDKIHSWLFAVVFSSWIIEIIPEKLNKAALQLSPFLFIT